MPRTHDESIDDRIREAADAEIEAHGLTGFRVSDVAERADTTVAMVYRRFVDRDGLVAATFAAAYRARYTRLLDLARWLLAKEGELTVDDVVDAIPPLRYDGSENARHRSQRIVATAMDNTALRIAMREITLELAPRLRELVDQVVERFPEGQRFDPRIILIYLTRHNALVDEILDEDGMSNEEYRSFLRQLLVDSMN